MDCRARVALSTLPEPRKRFPLFRFCARCFFLSLGLGWWPNHVVRGSRARPPCRCHDQVLIIVPAQQSQRLGTVPPRGRKGSGFSQERRGRLESV